jgi:hypothetical protein
LEEQLKSISLCYIRQKTDLTPEEIAKRAKDLSDWASKKYKEKQRKLEEDQEKFRIQQSNKQFTF